MLVPNQIKWFKIAVRPSKLHGLGGFATTPIPKGTKFDTLPVRGFHGLNYSDSPNAAIPEPIQVGQTSKGRPIFEVPAVALRDIVAGEEITLPYYD